MYSNNKEKEIKKENRKTFPSSLQEYFVVTIGLLIVILSLPPFLSGAFLMESIIRDFGQKLLQAHLQDLMAKVEQRYKTLERIGLEDSTSHIEEIEKISIEEFSRYRFEKTGRVFVVKRNGDVLLSDLLKNLNNEELQHFVLKLNNLYDKNSFINFHVSNSDYVAIGTYCPRWDSFIGIHIKKTELFSSKYEFITINALTLALVLVIACFCIHKIQDNIVRPIVSLAHYADDVSKGREGGDLRGSFKFEIELLKDNFMNMLKNLKTKIAESKSQLSVIESRELQLKAALKALENEKERLSITLQSIGDAVIATDKQGKIEIMNSVAERLTGWRWQEAYGMPLKEVFKIVNEKTGEPAPDPVSKIIKTGMVVGLANSTILIAKDGTKRIVADSGAPIKDSSGNILGIVLVFRDETEKRKMQEELIKMEKLKSVGVLAGGIAHDFNNILAAILGNISILSLSSKLDENERNLLKQAEKACLRARDLTQQLLTFAKGGAPVKETHRLDDIVIDSAKFILTGSGVKLEISSDPDLWYVKVDKGQFSQVIQNLVLNAKEAMDGKGTIWITLKNMKDYRPVSSTQTQDWVLVEIKDNGPGIPLDIQDNIFEPYFTTKEHGSGLGLSICHSIVTKHDGIIEVEGDKGQGATFKIFLPRAKETVQSGIIEADSLEETKKTARILLVDDDKMVLSTAKEVLEYLGHEVEAVSSGREAVKKYKEAINSDRPFHCVITDLTMPGGMDGSEVKDEILKIDKNAKVIVSSGYAQSPLMAEFEKHGFFGVLKKPYRLIELDKTIRAVLNA